MQQRRHFANVVETSHKATVILVNSDVADKLRIGYLPSIPALTRIFRDSCGVIPEPCRAPA